MKKLPNFLLFQNLSLSLSLSLSLYIYIYICLTKKCVFSDFENVTHCCYNGFEEDIPLSSGEEKHVYPYTIMNTARNKNRTK